MVERTKPDLWNKIVLKYKRSSKGGNPGEWSARKAQFAVREYKELGGEYKGNKRPSNSLSQWTKQDWGYVGEPGKSRYLPKKARDILTPAQKAAGSRKKNKATQKGKQFADYTTAELKAVRRALQ